MLKTLDSADWVLSALLNAQECVYQLWIFPHLVATSSVLKSCFSEEDGKMLAAQGKRKREGKREEEYTLKSATHTSPWFQYG